jgi:dual specificity tyrosine-phosphorylation-regulated kinase 2/3/4
MDEPSLSHFPMPGHGGAGYGPKTTTFKSNNPWAKSEATVPVRSTRSNSVRRQSDFTRLTGHGSSTNPSMLPPAAPASRARRQSHAPLPSSSSVSSRPPRKSIGPVTLMTEPSDDAPPRRRVSLSTREASVDNTKTDPSLRLRTRNLEPHRAEDGKVPASARYLKARSLQPPSREQPPAEDLLSPSGANYSRSSSTNGLHTPVKNAVSGANTPSSSKRVSMMPHATGLGARTISPTDARRMKRISMMPQAPPMPITPPTQNPPDLSMLRPRSSAQSPSMIPRKSETPSSSRTTPDPNRKSYSSGISLSSNTSYNSTRNSSGSFQPRLSQAFSSSRLPTPKPRVESMNNAAEEEVPPVPAIPKAFESPKTEIDLSTPATVRKSSLPSEIYRFSVDSRRDSDSSGAAANVSEDPMPTTSHTRGSKTPDAKGKQPASLAKKGLQPLKLPPFNLLPLSTPMAAKIDALKDTSGRNEMQACTPPPRLDAPTTPSTPMTASKASFFFNSDELDADSIHFPRSRTSHFLVSTSNSSIYRAPSSSSAIVPLEMPSTNRNISPYISSSLPKAGGDFRSMRQKASDDYSQSSVQLGKLTGPRPQTQSSAFSSNTEGGSRMSSTSDLEKSASTLRNTANLTLRHSVSKPQLASDTESNASKYDNMPPPRLPASATWNGLSSVSSRTSPALKPAYLIARRKSSISSLTNTINTRQPAMTNEQSLGPDQSPTAGESSETDNLAQSRPASSILSPVHKIFSSAKSNVASKSRSMDPNMDPGEFAADEEMRRLGSKRRDFESAAKELDELRRRASAKERVSPAQALKMASLNIFERGEIIDFKDIFFCGTQKAKKHVGDLKSQSANFGYDDDRGDYQIVIGDHLAYRYEIVDLLGKGSFGQVVRCVDHKTGGLVAVKIIRNKKRFHQQALVEVNILQKLREWVGHVLRYSPCTMINQDYRIPIDSTVS